MKDRFFFFTLVLIFNFGLIYLFNINISFSKVFEINIFLFLLLLLTQLMQFQILKKNGIILLLSINFLRIIACVFFLLPTILRNSTIGNIYIYNFLICYFLYLLFPHIFKKNLKKNK